MGVRSSGGRQSPMREFQVVVVVAALVCVALLAPCVRSAVPASEGTLPRIDSIDTTTPTTTATSTSVVVVSSQWRVSLISAPPHSHTENALTDFYWATNGRNWQYRYGVRGYPPYDATIIASTHRIDSHDHLLV